MNIQNILIILTVIHISKTETPKLICLPQKPFQTDSNCGDFMDVCVKKDDLQCNNFQAACQQCPPTNYTVSMLLHLNGQLNRSNLNQKEIKEQINISNTRINVSLKEIVKKFTDQIGIGIACLIFILLNFLFDILVFLKDKGYKKNKPRKENWEASQCLINNPQIMHSEEGLQTIINEKIKLLVRINNEKDMQLLDKIKNEKKFPVLESAVYHKLRFQLPNQFDETELFVSNFDSVIKLKKKICDRNMNMIDYKRIIMKYKGVTLDNNQYLLSCIDSTNIPIFCEFDDNVDVNEMIVIELKCDNIYNEMLQIWKHQQIKDLKIIISKLNKTNYKDLLIFYESTHLDDDDKTIDDYKIEDNDWLQVVNKFEEMLHISIKSIFTDKEKISIDISKLETVSNIINKSIQKIQQIKGKKYEMASNHFAVFLNKKLLRNDKFIYEYNFDSKSLVEFCYFKSLDKCRDNISLVSDFGHIKMFKAMNKSFDRPMLLKAYTKTYMEISHKNKDLSMILREDLQMFQIIKSHPRFIQLFDIYMDDDWIYIGLENSTKIPMRNHLSMNNEILTHEISKWANQILEGLQHLHNNNIIMKDMNPMDIWINGNHDVKLLSFNLTEYLDHLNDDEPHKYKHKDGILAYVAPEILESKPYEASVDVWSLGAVMIEVVTRAQLFPGLSESDAVKMIKQSHKIEYDKTKIPPHLINFIDCCVKGDPKERATIDQLMKHEFIVKYLLFSDFL